MRYWIPLLFLPLTLSAQSVLKGGTWTNKNAIGANQAVAPELTPRYGASTFVLAEVA